MDFPISGSGPLSQRARSLGYHRFAEVAEAIRALPYGRVRDTQDVAAVLKEHKGTCSSKHRFLAALAHECGRPDVQLMVGLYGMSERNTPGIGPALREEQLSDIPEAHCYLMYASQRFDFTGLAAGSASPFESLVEECVVSPADLPSAKLALHRRAVDLWARARDMDPDRAWAIRERCIALLADSTPHAHAGATSSKETR
jgi:hypothetical protein